MGQKLKRFEKESFKILLKLRSFVKKKKKKNQKKREKNQKKKKKKKKP